MNSRPVASRIFTILAVVATVLVAATIARPPAAFADATESPSCLLPDGTAGEAETSTPHRVGSPTDPGPGVSRANPTTNGLPRRVDLSSPTLSQNRRWYFGLREGRLFYKPNTERTGKSGSWRHVSTPACLDGDIQEISADDDELVALNSGRWIYTMDQALSSSDQFNWTSRWGFPFWGGPGFTAPANVRAWSWSVISPRESRYWVDPAGNRQTVGEGKVSHVWSLSPSGQRFTLNDPWLPRDRSYEMCGPRRGRLKAINFQTSGSTMFTIDRFGDMYTRLFDFDIAGMDNIFFDYSWDDQRGRPRAPIQLPGASWVQQPKVPGKITDRISIFTIGRGTVHRILRIEGWDSSSRPGVWQKDSADLSGPGAWKFISTPGAKILGNPVANPAADASSRALGPGEDSRYVHVSGTGGDWSGEIPDFNNYCGLSKIRIQLSHGKRLDLDLHLVDRIRTDPRARGLDDNPRLITATIEVGDDALRVAMHNTEAQAFIDQYFGQTRFTTFDLLATASEVKILDLGWTFSRASAPPGGVCVTESGFHRAAVKPVVKGLSFRFRTRTESPMLTSMSRVGTLQKTTSPRLVKSFTGTKSFSWRDRAGSLTDGYYVIRMKTLTLGGRVDTRRFAIKRRDGRFILLSGYTQPQGCELLRRYSLSSPVFGAGGRPGSLGVRLSTVEPATAVLKLRRGKRTVRRIEVGKLNPAQPRSLRLSAAKLKRGRYAIELTLTTPDGRVERARLSSSRL